MVKSGDFMFSMLLAILNPLLLDSISKAKAVRKQRMLVKLLSVERLSFKHIIMILLN